MQGQLVPGRAGQSLPAIHPPPAHGVLVMQTAEVFVGSVYCPDFPKPWRIDVTLIAKKGREPHSPTLSLDRGEDWPDDAYAALMAVYDVFDEHCPNPSAFVSRSSSSVSQGQLSPGSSIMSTNRRSMPTLVLVMPKEAK